MTQLSAFSLIEGQNRLHSVAGGLWIFRTDQDRVKFLYEDEDDSTGGTKVEHGGANDQHYYPGEIIPDKISVRVVQVQNLEVQGPTTSGSISCSSINFAGPGFGVDPSAGTMRGTSAVLSANLNAGSLTTTGATTTGTVSCSGTGTFRQLDIVQTGSGQYGILNLRPNVGGTAMSQGSQIASVGGTNSGTRFLNYVAAAGADYGTRNFFTGATGESYGGLAPSLDIDGNGVLNTRSVRPCNDNDHNLGSSTKAWADVFSVNTLTVTSDITLKDVQGEAPGLNLLMQLKPITYRWKEIGKRVHFGFSAQDVHEVLKPMYPMTEEDHPRKNMCGLYWYKHQEEHQVKDEKGEVHTIAEKETCGLRPSELIAVLTKSIQELTHRVQVLEAELGSEAQVGEKRQRTS
jgi:hypothetical protein